MMNAYDLVTPRNASEWRAYHDIRCTVLFEARGLFGVYDEHHPDEQLPNNHPRILLYVDDPVGVIRIDIDGVIATLRRVAIRSDVQGRGHGRVLLELAQQFAERWACTQLTSFVAPDAVGFYERNGFRIETQRVIGPSEREATFMTKGLPRAG